MIVHDIVEALAQDVRSGKATPGTNAYKVGAYYDACMDTLTIEALGTKPIEATMARIAAIHSAADLPAALADLHRIQRLAPFGVSATLDLKNSSRMIVSVGPSSPLTLTLPTRNYYLSTAAPMQQLRDSLVAHVARVFQLSGESATDAAAHAKTVLTIETKFAQAMTDNVAMRNVDATYHLMSMAQVDSLTPHFKWEPFLRVQGAPTVTEINVEQPEFFRTMDEFLTSIPIEDWKAFLRWRLLDGLSRFTLPKRYAEEDFAFRTLLTGQREPQARWRSCTTATTSPSALGDAVGQAYIERTFPPAAKARVQGLVDEMIAVLHDQIQQLDWMRDATKQQALRKLAAFTSMTGYPDQWRDYSGLEVKRGEYQGNTDRWLAWSQTVTLAKVGKPVDKTEWWINTFTVDAFARPDRNLIVFPAGILQPPFFDPSADDAVNYGAIGATIGHELSHHFDDQGRRFDAQGNLTDWWTAADAEQYNVQAQRLVDQFNAYTVVDSTTHVNGMLTLSENIADLAGLKIAYLALERSLAKNGRPPLIDGFTPEQRFFLGYAQILRTLQRDEAAKVQVSLDEHAPPKWRVNGSLSNMPEFKAAWGCKDGDPMVRPEALRARIW
jgi:putative endopeptidase